MLRVSPAMALLMAIFVVMVATGCVGTQTSSGGPGVAIPITDLKAIAGKWSGHASRATSDMDDWLEVTLHDDGTFEAFSAKQIGVFQDKGNREKRGTSADRWKPSIRWRDAVPYKNRWES